MTVQPQHVAEVDTATLFTAIEFDGFRLLLPAAEAEAIESPTDLYPNDSVEQRSIGQMSYLGRLWPVYCMDPSLRVIQDPPISRRMCVLLASGDNEFGLLCDHAYPLENADLSITPVPACMQHPDLAFTHLGMYQDKLAYFSSVAKLDQLLHGK